MIKPISAINTTINDNRIQGQKSKIKPSNILKHPIKNIALPLALAGFFTGCILNCSGHSGKDFPDETTVPTGTTTTPTDPVIPPVTDPVNPTESQYVMQQLKAMFKTYKASISYDSIETSAKDSYKPTTGDIIEFKSEDPYMTDVFTLDTEKSNEKTLVYKRKSTFHPSDEVLMSDVPYSKIEGGFSIPLEESTMRYNYINEDGYMLVNLLDEKGKVLFSYKDTSEQNENKWNIKLQK